MSWTAKGAFEKGVRAWKKRARSRMRRGLPI